MIKTYIVSPSNMSVVLFFLSAELRARMVDKAGPTSSDPVYFIFTYGTKGSPILSVALNKLPKLIVTKYKFINVNYETDEIIKAIHDKYYNI